MGQAPFSGAQVHSIFAGGDSSSSGLASGFMDASNSGIGYFGADGSVRNPASMPHQNEAHMSGLTEFPAGS